MKREIPDDAQLIVGANKSTPKEYLIPGSKLYDCTRCGAQLWLAPTGQKVLKDGKTMPVCLNCMAELADDGKVDDMTLAPGAKEELRDNFLRKLQN
jgi:hypothetical protein